MRFLPALLLVAAVATAQSPSPAPVPGPVPGPEEGLDLGTGQKFSGAASVDLLGQLQVLRAQVQAKRDASAPQSAEAAALEAQIGALSDQIDQLQVRLDHQRDQETFQKAHRLLTLAPTRLGFGARRHESPAGTLDPKGYTGLTFDLNVGVSGLVSPKDDLSRPGSWVWGANLLYSGSYDFRMDLYSGPVLSRVQNPQVGVFFDGVGPRGSVVQNVFLGWAHESNGQYATSDADFTHLAQIDPQFHDQFFASMGWDYYFVRYTRFFRWDPVSLMPRIEVRHLIRQAQGNPLAIANLEDKANITGLPIRGSGIRAYDGLRLGTLFGLGDRFHGNADLILPTLWDLNKDYHPLEQVGFEVSAYYEGMVTPYVTLRGGTRVDPAYYFSHEWSIAAGVALETFDFWPK